jgi:hypothetical protein
MVNIQGARFKGQRLEFGVWGLGFGSLGLGYRVKQLQGLDIGFRV